MSRDILINVTSRENRIAVVNNGALDEFYIEVFSQEEILGNIYRGKIQSIVPSINAAFVDIGEPRNGFLYMTELTNPLVEDEIPEESFWSLGNRSSRQEEKKQPPKLKIGQEVLVQVVKEPFGNKGPRLTTHISLAGRYLVLMPLQRQVGISRRIENKDERARLKEIIEKNSIFRNRGFIVRTVASRMGRRELVRDAQVLVKLWENIKRNSEKKAAPLLINREFGLVYRIMRDNFTDDIDNLYIDSKYEYANIMRFARNFLGRNFIKKIKFYRKDTPLFESFKIEHEVSKLYEKRVSLKSGAYIVIESTEGLCVIDVNSGKFKSHGSPEQLALRVNLDASPEIARQLRLRDLGGIVVIDFIDMERDKNRRAVLSTLKQALSGDRAKTEVLGISKLGLIEMTRERTSRPIESAYYKMCPYCGGKGRLKIQ
ncbi:Rne/Rng family ribonuclease [Candidatus Omnitrophota bacterium]